MWKWLGCVVLSAAGAAHGAKVCERDWACLETVTTAQGARVYVESFRDAPITVTVFLNATNLDTTHTGVITRVIEQKGRLLLADLRPVDKTQRWHLRPKMAATLGRIDARPDEAQLYHLPYAPGESYRVMQGWDGEFSHKGHSQFCLDFDMPEGSAVYAARAGKVIEVVDHHRQGGVQPDMARFANYVVLLHDDGTTGEYYHLQHASVRVAVGDRVEAGRWLAASGNTGYSSAPHLHFGVYVASSWGKTESVPTRFITADGVKAELKQGETYRAIYLDDVGGQSRVSLKSP